MAGSRLHRHPRRAAVGDRRGTQPELVARRVRVPADGPVRRRSACGGRLPGGCPGAGGLPRGARGALGRPHASRARDRCHSRADCRCRLQELAAPCARVPDQALLPQQIRLPARVAALRRHALDGPGIAGSADGHPGRGRHFRKPRGGAPDGRRGRPTHLSGRCVAAAGGRSATPRGAALAGSLVQLPEARAVDHRSIRISPRSGQL